MTTATKTCGVCDLRHVTKPPTIWCLECDEGLCTECQEHHSLSKGTRNHDVIPITEYTKLPADVLMISQNCIKHDKKYQMYCQKHECPCCSKCILESHKECRDLVEIDDVIHNVKTSNAICEIEETLVEVAENIQKIRQSQQDNLTKFKENRKDIETEIKKTRIKINNHLDKLQEDLMKKVYAEEEKEHSKICQLLSTLETKETDIAECQRKIINIKKHATDLQVFLSMTKIEEDVYNKTKFLQSLEEDKIFNQISLSYKINSSIQNIMSDIRSFGDVRIKAESCDIVLTRNKAKQAQMMKPTIQSTSIKKNQLTIQKTINTQGELTCGCCILSDGRFAFTYFRDCKVVIFKEKGEKDFDVELTCEAFDLANIGNNSLAVTSGDSEKQCITIIDLEKKKITKTIPLYSYNYGIIYKDYRLIYSGNNNGILMMYLHDESISNIVRETMPRDCHIATFRDNIYHTNHESNSVTCYNLQGEIQWKFQNESVLKNPRGIDVDSDGNVFVVGCMSYNVVVISPDGQRHREVLTGRDGLHQPVALYYSGQNNKLLVANLCNTAYSFDVKSILL